MLPGYWKDAGEPVIRQASRYSPQPAGDPFDDGLSVIVNLDTGLGPAHAVFTARNHCHAVSGYAHATASVWDDHPGLTVNGITRCGGVHLYAPTWEPRQAEPQPTWRCRPGDRKSPRTLAVQALTRAVAAFTAAHPQIPAAAELRNLLNARASELRNLAAARTTAAGIEAEITQLTAQIIAVEAELAAR
jgi:hypothetical protein